jgi:hypothetical protein
MTNAKDEAQTALFEAIAAHAEAVKSANMHPGPRAQALASLALAYRLAAGGPQPGGITVKE